MCKSMGGRRRMRLWDDADMRGHWKIQMWDDMGGCRCVKTCNFVGVSGHKEIHICEDIRRCRYVKTWNDAEVLGHMRKQIHGVMRKYGCIEAYLKYDIPSPLENTLGTLESTGKSFKIVIIFPDALLF